MKSFTCIIIFLFLQLFSLQSQTTEFKYGNINKSDLEATVCPIDSNAEAYIIGDYGSTSFDYNNDYDKIIFKRHFRLKILKNTQDALDYGKFEVKLYHYNGHEEKLENLKGNTYNLENGKIVISSLERKSTYTDDFNKNFRVVKYAMPNVKVGSIIEVYYELSSDYTFIYPWKFQFDIPNLYSEYLVEIPEFYSFKKFVNGYESIQSSSTSYPASINYTDKTHYGGTTQFHYKSYEYTINSTKYSCINIKAFYAEPNINSKVNYISTIEFELESEHFPQSIVKLHSHDWASIQKEYMSWDHFGSIVKSPGQTSKLVKTATLNIQDTLLKATSIYNYIRDNFKWNSLNSDIASKTINKTLEDMKGNSADINLLLVASLRRANLRADPVVLSTRDNGLILNAYPLISKLNYVIACLSLDGKQYFLDATNKYLPFGMLPEKCINGDGELFSNNGFQTVELKANSSNFENINCVFALDSTDNITGSLDELDKGYVALELRESLGNAKNQEDYIQSIQKVNPGLTISKFEFKNLDSLQKDPLEHYEFTLAGNVELTGDLLMIHPLLFEQKTENEFKMEERKYPVDFNYNINKTYVATIIIPTGYQVETLPEQISLSMPDKAISFSYMISQKDNKIQVMRKFIIRKTLFLPNEYKDLKEFYNQMVTKESEPIVLKKITHSL